MMRWAGHVAYMGS